MADEAGERGGWTPQLLRLRPAAVAPTPCAFCRRRTRWAPSLQTSARRTLPSSNATSSSPQGKTERSTALSCRRSCRSNASDVRDAASTRTSQTRIPADRQQQTHTRHSAHPSRERWPCEASKGQGTAEEDEEEHRCTAFALAARPHLLLGTDAVALHQCATLPPRCYSCLSPLLLPLVDLLPLPLASRYNAGSPRRVRGAAARAPMGHRVGARRRERE